MRSLLHFSKTDSLKNNTCIENDGFKTQIDPVFRTQFLKMHKQLHGLSPVSCPNISYGTFKDNTALFFNDLTSRGGITVRNFSHSVIASQILMF